MEEKGKISNSSEAEIKVTLIHTHKKKKLLNHMKNPKP